MTRSEAKRRAAALVEQMTTEEMASQLLNDSPSIERLGVPAYNWWNEALHGVARAGLATMFPQAIAMAASFDRQLLGDVADAIANEARAKCNAARKEGDRGIYKGLTFWSPNVNIFRDPRWGRGQETYGEDPFLTAEMGKTFVRHMQGDGEFLKTAACAKHFAVHSGPENQRHTFDVCVRERDLWETYLPAFEQLVKEAGVESVMGAYNRVNGEPCCGSQRLLEEILRGQWGFEGHVVSDCGAIADFHLHHHVTDSGPQSAAMALKSGCDLNCGCAYACIMQALRQGLIEREDIARAAVHLFTTRFLLGEFEENPPFADISLDVVDSPAHQALNRTMAQEAMVLLKNDGILPLEPSALRSVAIIGPCAASVSVLEGNYCGTAGEYITLADGIRRALPDARVYVAQGSHLYRNRTEDNAAMDDRISEAVSLAKMTDLTILCVGLDSTIEGEEGDGSNAYSAGDKRDLYLPVSQQHLVQAVCKVTDNVIVVVTAGSAMDLGVANTHARAILHAWYPGSRGGEAVADILFGRCSPSGRLPVTFYRGEDPLPDFTEYSMAGRTYRYLQKKPLYPFGFGLSYTEFSYASLSVATSEQGATVTVSVTNTGGRAGREVVQVYAAMRDSRYPAPQLQLCGFTSVMLRPGETARAEVDLPAYWLQVVSEEGSRVEPDGGIILYVGGHQPDARSRELGCADCLEWRL
ncbi:MAG: glycoside hydrolase family 3 C-terminal domain-containing protein [Acutalibacteraceae bacterium]